MFREDLPASVIVDSDFSYLNERLATHYQVPGVSGAEMRMVKLPKNSVRGGLVTQASVLKVTANGTTTSPVIRGSWIAERVLGVRIAPPPSVPAVSPTFAAQLPLGNSSSDIELTRAARHVMRRSIRLV